MSRLQVGDLARKKGIAGKFLLQSREQLESTRLVLFPHIGNGEKDAREWCEIMTVLGSGLQVCDAALLVGR